MQFYYFFRVIAPLGALVWVDLKGVLAILDIGNPSVLLETQDLARFVDVSSSASDRILQNNHFEAFQ